MKNAMRSLTAVILLAGLTLFTPASPAGAAGIVGTGSPASCTEAALDAALAGGGFVSFNCGGAATIPLTSEKVIAVDTSVNGGGLITLDGQGQTRIFWVNDGTSLTLNGLTLTGGNGVGAQQSGDGGAIATISGTLTIKDSTISGNTASGSGGGFWTAFGNHTITDSTFSGNTAGSVGGGFSTSSGNHTITDSTFSGNTAGSVGGGFSTFSGSHTVSNSTFSGNTASGSGGGFWTAFGNHTITDSTFSGNTAGSDGGGFRTSSGNHTITNTTFSGNSADGLGDNIRKASVPGALKLRHTIIAGGTGDNCGGPVTSQDYNLSDDGTCNLNQGNDLPNTPAGLGPLGNYGGPTQTHHPFAGSAAIDSATCITATDQRGITRPQGPICDRGSVEVLTPVDLTTLCVNFYTGAVTSPNSGQCGAGQWQITLPAPWPLNFCIDPFTGQVSFAFGGCAPPRTPHVVPNDGPLLVCWSRFTGQLRHVTDAAYCNFEGGTLARIPSEV